jgi:hypothetical protein
MNWIKFKEGCKLPPERRYVLVHIGERPIQGINMPPAVGVGYLRIWSGGPWFVIPGMGGDWTVTHYCDCLGDNFEVPNWEGKQTP